MNTPCSVVIYTLTSRLHDEQTVDGDGLSQYLIEGVMRSSAKKKACKSQKNEQFACFFKSLFLYLQSEIIRCRNT